MLQACFKGGMQKKYLVLDLEENLLIRQDGSAISIEGSRWFHIMCFKPDGSILCKVNKCSCVVSLLDNFLECLVEPGKLYSEEEGSDDDYDSDIEYEDDNAFGDSIDENMRKYEL